MRYPFTDIEQRWQAIWAEQKTFRTANPGDDRFDASKPKFYVLDMFPYPSGVGLHVGHPLGYIATDIVARYKRMQGFNVLHPMGYDAFGLPAEQFAVEHGVHPAETTQKNIDNMTRQLKRLGLGYDWDRALATTDVSYYKWTQWIFLQLYHSWFDPIANAARPIADLVKSLEGEDYVIDLSGELVYAGAREDLQALGGDIVGTKKWFELTDDEKTDLLDSQRLAFLDEVPVNWCPALGTVLANEEVTNEGRSERGNHPVYKRPLKQWMLRITSFAERLIEDLEHVAWPEPIKKMQREWIGRSEGALVDFAINGHDEDVIRVFTTRPDTLFGATYMVLAPEHPLVEQITSDERREAIDRYRVDAAARSDVERAADDKSKTGEFTGAFAINPVNDEKIPIWIADYVMMGYGTGAIMAVPAHDERDYAFAKAFELPIKDVVYTPVLAAIAGFSHEYKNDKRGEDLLADYVAYCLNEQAMGKAVDYENAYREVLEPRNAAAMAGNEDTSETSHRDSPLWQSELKPFAETDIDTIVKLAHAGELVDFLNEALTDTERGVSVNSSNDDVSLNGLPVADAKATITDWLVNEGVGSAKVQYKLRDWLFSRQRYWGEPFPILHEMKDGKPTGAIRAVDEADLPVELPPMEDFKPHASDDPEAEVQTPLSRADDEWKYVEIDGKLYQREMNTMPQWAGSCWYYLRFLDPTNEDRFVGEEAERYWMLSRKKDGTPHFGGIDLYVGGAEHAVLHLLYARFWHKVLFDLGHVSTPEPFGKLFNQGYIQAFAYTDERGVYMEATKVTEDADKTSEVTRTELDKRTEKQVEKVYKTNFYYEGQPVVQEYGKMGKSLKNAVAPDDMCEQYGADSLRLYEMYLGPLDVSKPWNTQDIVGVHRFLQRLWRNFVDEESGDWLVAGEPADDELRKALHKTIHRVTEAMNSMSFNVAIAALIEFNNKLVAMDKIPHDVAEPLVQLLSPMAPHICEELWQKLGHDGSIAEQAWPIADPALLKEDSVELPVQVNGKVRGRITIPADADQAAAEAAALADEKVQAAIEGKTVRKVIVVNGRMVNIVVG